MSSTHIHLTSPPPQLPTQVPRLVCVCLPHTNPHHCHSRSALPFSEDVIHFRLPQMKRNSSHPKALSSHQKTSFTRAGGGRGRCFDMISGVKTIAAVGAVNSICSGSSKFLLFLSGNPDKHPVFLSLPPVVLVHLGMRPLQHPAHLSSPSLKFLRLSLKSVAAIPQDSPG